MNDWIFWADFLTVGSLLCNQFHYNLFKNTKSHIIWPQTLRNNSKPQFTLKAAQCQLDDPLVNTPVSACSCKQNDGPTAEWPCHFDSLSRKGTKPLVLQLILHYGIGIDESISEWMMDGDYSFVPVILHICIYSAMLISSGLRSAHILSGLPNFQRTLVWGLMEPNKNLPHAQQSKRIRDF